MRTLWWCERGIRGSCVSLAVQGQVTHDHRSHPPEDAAQVVLSVIQTLLSLEESGHKGQPLTLTSTAHGPLFPTRLLAILPSATCFFSVGCFCLPATLSSLQSKSKNFQKAKTRHHKRKHWLI